MAYRQPPLLPVPPVYTEAMAVCMAAKPLQHQDELTALLTFTQQLDPPLDLRVIVEIGSFRGGTLELWARIASQCVVSIDLPDGMPGTSNCNDTQMSSRNTRLHREFRHVHGIVGDSHDRATLAQLRRLLDGDPIDLLFIDGDHTYAGVSADYDMYSPLVRRGGVVAFHDLVCPPDHAAANHSDVPQFWATLPSPKFRFHCGAYWGGIGAIVMT